MKYFILAIIFFISGTCLAQSVTEKQWLEDIAYLKKELPQNHVDLFHKKSRNYFNSTLDQIASEVSNLDDLTIAIKLQQFISSFGDSHTNITWGKYVDNKQLLPLQFHWLKEGIFVIQATKNHQNILGLKLLKINDIPVQVVIDSLSTLLTLDNTAIGKRDIPQLISLSQLLRYFKIATNDSIFLDLKNTITGDAINSYLLVIPNERPDNNDFVQLKSEKNTISFINRDKLFHSHYMTDEKLYYIQYNKCWSKELEIEHNNGKNAEKLPSFTEFEENVINELKNDSIDKLVFDLRYNSGGNSLQGTLFIEKIMRHPKILKGIPVFVLIGRKTYSSAIINVMDFKKYSNVTLIGEETAGKPNHFGEVRKFTLPNSGLTVGYSTKYFQRTSGNENTIKPDVEILLSISDFVKGIDPLLEYVIGQ